MPVARYCVRGPAGDLHVDAIVDELRGHVAALDLLGPTRRNVVWAKGTGQRWLTVSPSFAVLLGHTVADISAQPWQNLVHPQDIPTTQAELDRVMVAFDNGQTKVRGKVTNRYRHKDSPTWTLIRWVWDFDGSKSFAAGEIMGEAK